MSDAYSEAASRVTKQKPRTRLSPAAGKTASGASRTRKSSASSRTATDRQTTVRLSADLPERDADTLADLARITGFNKVTTLVRAIRVLAELVRAEEANGELTIKYPDGRRERLIIR